MWETYELGDIHINLYATEAPIITLCFTQSTVEVARLPLISIHEKYRRPYCK